MSDRFERVCDGDEPVCLWMMLSNSTHRRPPRQPTDDDDDEDDDDTQQHQQPTMTATCCPLQGFYNSKALVICILRPPAPIAPRYKDSSSLGA